MIIDNFAKLYKMVGVDDTFGEIKTCYWIDDDEYRARVYLRHSKEFSEMRRFRCDFEVVEPSDDIQGTMASYDHSYVVKYLSAITKEEESVIVYANDETQAKLIASQLRPTKEFIGVIRRLKLGKLE